MNPPDRSGSTATHNLSPESLALFERSWRSYHRVVEGDLMEHAGLLRALAAHLDAFVRDWGTAPLRFADLACGDLTTLAPLLRALPLAAFTGVDAAATALELAQSRMQGWGVPCLWPQEDLLHWAQQRGERLAVITCLFGLHHLADADKQRFLEAVAGRLAEGGVLLIGDVFREPGEQRQAYVQRYVRRIREQWTALETSLQNHVIDHLSSSDFPAQRDVFASMAERAGWHSRWIWNGTHRAEALLALRRAV
jgi:2-polyprenyl-3-methyl-5-hydroxy-6-metoxy-1,4-benzoquinol methylase